jgi:hypothetical protein
VYLCDYPGIGINIVAIMVTAFHTEGLFEFGLIITS